MNETRKTNRRSNINRSQELTILRKIVEITNSEPDLSMTLHEVVQVVNDMTKADSVFVYLFDEKKENLVLMASKTPHKKELGKINLRVGEGVAGWVVRENKPVAIEKNAYNDPRFKYFDVLPEDKYEALLSIPIDYKQKPIGVVNIQHKKSHEYAPATMNLISIIAKQMGGVIEHARLYEETRTKALQFDSLAKVSRSITSEGYLDEILNLIVVVTAEMLNSKICSIMILNEEKNELVIRATQSLSEDYRKKPNVKVGSSISGEVLRSQKPLAIYDVREESRYGFRDLARKEGLTSMLSVPMVVREKAIGIINIYMKTPHHFTKEETDVLQMVANQAAVAIENTKLMEEAMKAREALETRKFIERAKGILMRLGKLSEEDAHKLIHKKSMDSCRSMKDIAESIILMDDFQKSTKNHKNPVK